MMGGRESASYPDMSKGKHNSKRGTAAIIERHQKEGEALDAAAGIDPVVEEKLNPRFAFLKNGRPKAIQTAEELEERIHQYLHNLGRWGLPTKAGLCFALGISRETLYRYEKEDGFRDTLKHWYSLFEDMWAQNLSRPNATGTIFFLKNAHGYVDRHENDNNNRVIHYIIPPTIAAKHAVPITQVTEENHGADNATESAIAASEGESARLPAAQPTLEQTGDGTPDPSADGETRADTHQHQLGQAEGEVPNAVRQD